MTLIHEKEYGFLFKDCPGLAELIDAAVDYEKAWRDGSFGDLNATHDVLLDAARKFPRLLRESRR